MLMWRFVLGGAFVSVFALVADLVRPKRFAGLFAAAPSVALATLALTAHASGVSVAAIEARSMMVNSLGFVLYAALVQRLLASARAPAFAAALGALALWAAVAALAAVSLFGLVQ